VSLDLFSQVADTPQEIPFLSILQHLLSIDPREAVSDVVWDTAETLVHRATLLEHKKDASRLLRSPSVQVSRCVDILRGYNEITTEMRVSKRLCDSVKLAAALLMWAHETAECRFTSDKKFLGAIKEARIII